MLWCRHYFTTVQENAVAEYEKGNREILSASGTIKVCSYCKEYWFFPDVDVLRPVQVDFVPESRYQARVL